MDLSRSELEERLKADLFDELWEHDAWWSDIPIDYLYKGAIDAILNERLDNVVRSQSSGGTKAWNIADYLTIEPRGIFFFGKNYSVND